jgi:hypothetical protein
VANYRYAISRIPDGIAVRVLPRGAGHTKHDTVPRGSRSMSYAVRPRSGAWLASAGTAAKATNRPQRYISGTFARSPAGTRASQVSRAGPHAARRRRPTAGSAGPPTATRTAKLRAGCGSRPPQDAAGGFADPAARYSALMRRASSSWSSRMTMRQAASTGVPWSTSSRARAAMRSW